MGWRMEGLELGDVIGKETDQVATTVLQARRQNSLCWGTRPEKTGLYSRGICHKEQVEQDPEWKNNNRWQVCDLGQCIKQIIRNSLKNKLSTQMLTENLH